VAYPYVAKRLLTDEDPALRQRLIEVPIIIALGAKTIPTYCHTSSGTSVTQVVIEMVTLQTSCMLATSANALQ
jgi:hypothetical protein